MRFSLKKNGICMTFDLEYGKPVLLLHMGVESEFQEPDVDKKLFYTMQEIQATGESRLEHYGVGPSGTFPGNRMNYIGHKERVNEYGYLLEIDTKDPVTGLSSQMMYQFYDEIPVVRCWNTITNEGVEPIGLEMVSTFVHAGIADEQKEEINVLIPHNSWQEEIQWREMPIYQLGYRTLPECGFSSKRVQVRNIGSWSAGEYLPMGCLRNVTKGIMEFWQIEHNGSWNWEVQERDRKLTLVINGPDEVNHNWWKSLTPGESFTTVPAAVGLVKGGVDETFAALTKYRRIIRRKHRDNQDLPIIFNDYMNCLWADPTTEKELPIIDAAAEIGCEYYCIDAGWYTDENWWYKVGEWVPSQKRFPNGLKEVTDYIRAKGMIPGIWLEIEVMGTQCEMSEKVDKGWFFQRHGKAVLDRERYHLDFRNPEVCAYTRSTIDYLIQKYGIGYFKIDYNINTFTGTEYMADSSGDGLLEHNRAYLAWIDDIMKTYPDLVIENCGSGGMRMDYAMLSRHSIQSTSDQTNYLKYASIAANAPSALTPEQAAIWSYPMSESSREETIFNCVNSCMLRIHQSGHMGVLAEDKKALVKEEFALYKNIRKHIPNALPFWPLGLAKDGDDWMALGMDMGEKKLMALWHIKGADCCEIPLTKYREQKLDIKVIFPKEDSGCVFKWDLESGILKVKFPAKRMARLCEIICL